MTAIGEDNVGDGVDGVFESVILKSVPFDRVATFRDNGGRILGRDGNHGDEHGNENARD